MTIMDRFIDYWSTDLAYEDYKYDLSIFEQIIYGVCGVALFIPMSIGLIITAPLWGVPYMLYKAGKLKRCEHE